MSEQITIRRSKKKSSFIILAAVLLAGASFLSFRYSGDQVFGWIFLVASALAFILGVSNLRDRRPQIIITPEGITELYTIRDEIQWDVIRGVDDFFFRGQDFVRILLPEQYKPGSLRPTWFWRLNGLYTQQGLKALYIRVSGLEISSKQLVTLIKNMIATDPGQREGYLQAVKDRL